MHLLISCIVCGKVDLKKRHFSPATGGAQDFLYNLIDYYEMTKQHLHNHALLLAPLP